MFEKSQYITKLIDTGFVDTWRHLHPHVREYTWYSKRKDKTTGKSEEFNGFRFDYICLSGAAARDRGSRNAARTAKGRRI